MTWDSAVWEARYRWNRFKEEALLWVVWKLPPRWVYWACIRAWAHATQGPWGNEMPAQVSMDTVLTRWEKTHAIN